MGARVHAARGARALLALGAVLAVAATAAACGGRGATDGCPDEPGCGGNPVAHVVQNLDGTQTSTWQLGGFCQYRPPISYTVPTLLPPATQLSQVPTPVPAPKSPGDDCWGLEYLPIALQIDNGSHVHNVELHHGEGVVTPGPAPLILYTNGEYKQALKTVSKTLAHFPGYCLTAYGAHPSCEDLAVGLGEYSTAMPNYKIDNPDHPFDCVPTSSDSGCDCTYDYVSFAADYGTWRTVGSIMYFFSAVSLTQPVTETTYCVSPDQTTLSLTGRNGESMFDVKGLRALTLTLANN